LVGADQRCCPPRFLDKVAEKPDQGDGAGISNPAMRELTVPGPTWKCAIMLSLRLPLWRYWWLSVRFERARRETPLPDAIAAPRTLPCLAAHAEGAQVYECKAGADGKPSWASANRSRHWAGRWQDRRPSLCRSDLGNSRWQRLCRKAVGSVPVHAERYSLAEA